MLLLSNATRTIFSNSFNESLSDFSPFYYYCCCLHALETTSFSASSMAPFRQRVVPLRAEGRGRERTRGRVLAASPECAGQAQGPRGRLAPRTELARNMRAIVAPFVVAGKSPRKASTRTTNGGRKEEKQGCEKKTQTQTRPYAHLCTDISSMWKILAWRRFGDGTGAKAKKQFAFTPTEYPETNNLLQQLESTSLASTN